MKNRPDGRFSCIDGLIVRFAVLLADEADGQIVEQRARRVRSKARCACRQAESLRKRSPKKTDPDLHYLQQNPDNSASGESDKKSKQAE